jgi:hypothetical protein
MHNKFSVVRWLALFVYFAGLVFVFATKNVKMWNLCNIAATGLLCFDGFVITPRPTLSLFNTRSDVKPKSRPSPLMWVGFALLLVSCIYFSHIRTSALLAMSALLLLVLNRYTKTDSVPTNK